jgi:AcrR family transcriptional regulator
VSGGELTNYGSSGEWIVSGHEKAIDPKPPSLAEEAVRRRLSGRDEEARDDVRRLIAAGLKLMTEGNGSLNPPRVADIVREAGVSNQAFYQLFPSRDDLVAAIVDDGARRLLSYLSHAMDQETDPEDQLRRCVQGVMKQVSDPEIAGATRAVLSNGRMLRSIRGADATRLVDMVSALLAPTIERIGSDRPAADARRAAVVIIGMMEYFLWSGMQPGDDEVRALEAFVIGGLVGTRSQKPSR